LSFGGDDDDDMKNSRDETKRNRNLGGGDGDLDRGNGDGGDNGDGEGGGGGGGAKNTRGRKVCNRDRQSRRGDATRRAASLATRRAASLATRRSASLATRRSASLATRRAASLATRRAASLAATDRESIRAGMLDIRGRERHATLGVVRRVASVLLIKQEPQWQQIVELLAGGTNLGVVGFDARPLTRSHDCRHLDGSRAFGHECVIATLLDGGPRESLPWYRHKTHDYDCSAIVLRRDDEHGGDGGGRHSAGRPITRLARQRSA
jgi:hypothetical protein